MTNTQPTMGRIVHYTISEDNARAINAARTQSGTATKTGNTAREGDQFPLLIVRVWGTGSVNGQLTLDGNDSYWITSAPEAGTTRDFQHDGESHLFDTEGRQPGCWNWPTRV